ncbi:MAG: hypothetical protein A2169_12295 [Deltaproteobacteria bacterium RBG_13_47_9]|nr:MAG: hypothetical protein A2169_12295 [Deltaproteobacteria bacterium RBG_13_47_9]
MEKRPQTNNLGSLFVALNGLPMAEIKSTLELAMEKAKKFAISEKEKKEIEQKEMLQRATSLFHRYKEGRLPLNEILREIEKMENKTAAAVKELLGSQWIDALSLDNENESLLKGIESLKQRRIDEIEQEFYPLLSQYLKEKEKVNEDVEGQLIEALKKEGISGSAVELKIEGDELWEKEKEKLDQRYRGPLKEFKERLRNL